MFTRFLNFFGIYTAEQKFQQQLTAARMRRASEQRVAAYFQSQRAGSNATQIQTAGNMVITSPDVPKKTTRPKPPTKPTGQVRQERYGYSEQDSYRFDNHYVPGITTNSDSCSSSSSGSSDSGSSYSSSSDSGGSSSSDSGSC